MSEIENQAIRVLLIEDDTDDAVVIQEIIAEFKRPKFEFNYRKNLKEGLEFFLRKEVDVVLLDLSLPDCRGLRTFHKIQEAGPEVPIIILSGFESDEMAIQAVGEGAQDYLVKSTINGSMLFRVLRYAIERQRAAKRIYAAEEKYRTVFENSAVGITVVDGQGQIISWNKFCEDLLGMNREDLYQKHVQTLYPAEEWQKLCDCKIRQKGNQEHFDTKMFRKNATAVDVDISISVLKDIDGNITGSIGIFRDITERKRLERMKDEFISTVSHELRTPMTIVREGVSQVLDGILGEITDDQRQILEITLEGIDRLSRIINDLLDISKLDAGRVELKKERGDLKEVFEHVGASFQPAFENKGLKWICDFPQEKYEYSFDRDKIIQVLTNLIGNALKFTDKGSIAVRLTEEPDGVVCSVEDTGPGIASDDLKHVFDRFSQFGRVYGPGEKGTGLGLAISKVLVEMHGGKIWAESQLGQGTKFFFSLPKIAENG
ncbi:MAG: PAS domain S-box protein [Candidatus Omnitrophica bacterium]|nr:PAS domain S-box protein [Candidatus Omnitrophota bacterium]